MNTETKQMRSENTTGSFPESRRFHSMTVRGIGVLADVSGGLFDGEARPESAVVAQLSNHAADFTFATAA
jgi:hypothetical protein